MTSVADRLRTWLRRISRLSRLGSIERAMDDEMRHHIECEIADRVRAGETPDAARRAALRDFGGMERFKEEARDARGLRPFEDLVADTRHALRVLRRTPVHTAAVLLTFAVGIASAGAIYAVVYGVLLRPLPYADPDRLVAVWEHNVPRNNPRNVVSVANFEAWQRAGTSFTDLAALVPRPITLSNGDVPERVMGAEVSHGYFRLLGIRPALGRDFEAADENSTRPSVALLSHDFWTRRFNADPRIIGRTVASADGAFTVIGVMPGGFEPPRFSWLGTQDLWFPFASTEENRKWGRFLLVVARLKPDVTLERARTQMTTLADRLAVEMPGNRGWNVTIVPLAEQLTGDVRTPLRTLLAAVALLFAIAVANVATLTAAATRRRGQELAIRRSFGATDSRLFRQLCTQHVLLGVAGAAAGLAAIPACVGVLRTLAPPTLPRLASIHVDAPTLMVTIGFVAIAIAVFSAIASAPRETAAVRLIEEATTYGTAERRAGGGLVMAELAVALTLGIMAALMARSVVGLRSVDMGFDAAEVVAARVSLAGAAGAGSASTVFFDDLLARVHALPGVASAGIISTRPLSAPGSATAVSDPSRPSDSAPNEVVADIRYVNPTLFDTLRIPLLAGRTFDGRETPDGPITVVISETLARSFWPNQSALGRDLQLVLYGGITASIVGVVGDVHFVDARTPARAAAYLSAARFSSGTRDLIVRASGDPLTLVPSLRAAVTALAPGVPLFQVKGMAQAVAAVTARERFTTFVLSAFAFVALALGGVGVFGVIAGEVGRRRKEIGLRMALGAGRDAVAWLMLRQTATRAAVGIAAGALIASWLAHSMTSMLFGVEPLDPASYLTTIAVVLGLALVATLIPVAGALRRSPLEALREN